MWGNIRKYQSFPHWKPKHKIQLWDIYIYMYIDRKGLIFFIHHFVAISYRYLCMNFRTLKHLRFLKKNPRMLNPGGSLRFPYSEKKLTTRTEVTCICRIFSSYKHKLLELQCEDQFQGLGGKQYVLKPTLFKILSVIQWSMKESCIWEQNQVLPSNKLEMQSGLLTLKEYTTFPLWAKLDHFWSKIRLSGSMI